MRRWELPKSLPLYTIQQNPTRSITPERIAVIAHPAIYVGKRSPVTCRNLLRLQTIRGKYRQENFSPFGADSYVVRRTQLLHDECTRAQGILGVGI